MPEAVDWSRADKFTRQDRYFNIAVLWIFYYKYVIRALYFLRVRPMLALTFSTSFGLVGAGLIATGRHLAAAVCLHLKDVFDACDGSLARLTGRTSRIARFLDSLEDLLVLGTVTGVIAVQAYRTSGETWWLGLGAATLLSLALQCSYFNYYQVRYSEWLGHSRLLSRHDERVTPEDRRTYDNSLKQSALMTLQTLYRVAYGWQDALMQAIDSLSLVRLSVYPGFHRSDWYRQKLFLTLNSALGFGTHIFAFMICLLLGRPAWALVFISVVMNLYFVLVIALRILYFRILAISPSN